jgi:hypothetical protein
MKWRISSCATSGRVLRGDEDVGDRLRAIGAVQHRHLRLGVGTQPRRRAGLAQLGQRVRQAVRQEDGEGHQLRRLVGRVAEHDPLVARALVAGLAGDGVDALRDLRRLLGEEGADLQRVGVEELVGVGVADGAHGLAHLRLVVHQRGGGDLARQHHLVGLHQHLAGDAGVGVLREVSVQDAVRDGVADFVRVALGYGFRAEGVGQARFFGDAGRVDQRAHCGWLLDGPLDSRRGPTAGVRWGRDDALGGSP